MHDSSPPLPTHDNQAEQLTALLQTVCLQYCTGAAHMTAFAALCTWQPCSTFHMAGLCPQSHQQGGHEHQATQPLTTHSFLAVCLRKPASALDLRLTLVGYPTLVHRNELHLRRANRRPLDHIEAGQPPRPKPHLGEPTAARLAYYNHLQYGVSISAHSKTCSYCCAARSHEASRVMPRRCSAWKSLLWWR